MFWLLNVATVATSNLFPYQDLFLLPNEFCSITVKNYFPRLCGPDWAGWEEEEEKTNSVQFKMKSPV